MSAGALISRPAFSAGSVSDEHNLGSRAMLFLQAAIWSGMFVLFFCSPVLQMSDSQYSMLTADSIIRNHTPDLSSYRIKNYRADLPFDTISGTHAYQLARVNRRLLYGFGHGTSILSIPYVAAMEVIGISPATSDGQYNFAGEVILQKLLAALLMASLVVVFFRTAMLMLDWRWSAIVAIGAGLGTSVWSTASRGMWAHTWEIVLGGFVASILLENAVRARSLRPVLLATLVAWMFWVRPSGAIAAMIVGAYVVFRRPRDFIPFAVTGGLWLIAFVAYSHRVFGTVIPYYYLSNDPHGLGIYFGEGLYGVLFSPARGIFVYSPVLLVVFAMTAKYWRAIADRALAVVAISAFVAIAVASAAHPEWWGGLCYGARLLCDAIPWLVLLAILALAAMPEASRTLRNPLLQLGAATLFLSIVLNAYGAFSMESLAWSLKQRPIRESMLDWSRPPFLADWVDPR